MTTYEKAQENMKFKSIKKCISLYTLLKARNLFTISILLSSFFCAGLCGEDYYPEYYCVNYSLTFLDNF